MGGFHGDIRLQLVHKNTLWPSDVGKDWGQKTMGEKVSLEVRVGFWSPILFGFRPGRTMSPNTGKFQMVSQSNRLMPHLPKDFKPLREVSNQQMHHSSRAAKAKE